MSSMPARGLLLLWIGAGLGLALALASLASPAKGGSGLRLAPGVVALVNGQPIWKGDYDAALRTIEELQRRPADDRDRRAALDRVIDDELMIEYGLKLGMARDDVTTRQALLAAVFTAERTRGGDDSLAQKLADLRKASHISVAPQWQ